MDLAKVDLARIPIQNEEDIGVRCQLSDYDIAVLWTELRIQNVPTLIAIKNGEVVDKLVGYYDEDAVKSHINKLRDINVTDNTGPMSTRRHEMSTSQERQSFVNFLNLKEQNKAMAMSGVKTVVVLFTAESCQPCKVLMSWIESSPHIALDKVGQYS